MIHFQVYTTFSSTQIHFHIPTQYTHLKLTVIFQLTSCVVQRFLLTCKIYFFQSAGVKSQPESKCPELLANYCDMLLRKTPLSKRLTSDQIESKLRDVVSFIHVLDS